MAREKPDMFGADGKIDPIKTIRYLRQSGRQAAIRSSVRPRWENLAAELRHLRSVGNSLVLDGDDEEHLAPRRLLDPQPGSPAQTDRDSQSSTTVNRDNALLTELISEYLVATSDHLWAMTVIMSANPPFRPMLATGRILLDAGAHIHYLLDPSVTLDQRISRAVNVELDAIRQELNDLGPRDTDLKNELLGRQQTLLLGGDIDGIPRATSRAGAPQPSFAPGLITTGLMADLALGAGFGESIWRLASSVVHARDRSLLEFVGGRGDVDLSGDGLGWTMGIPFVASCLVGMTESYVRIASYLGRDTPELSRAVQRVFRTLQEMSGDHDDELLARAGVDSSDWD